MISNQRNGLLGPLCKSTLPARASQCRPPGRFAGTDCPKPGRPGKNGFSPYLAGPGWLPPQGAKKQWKFYKRLSPAFFHGLVRKNPVGLTRASTLKRPVSYPLLNDPQLPAFSGEYQGGNERLCARPAIGDDRKGTTETRRYTEKCFTVRPASSVQESYHFAQAAQLPILLILSS